MRRGLVVLLLFCTLAGLISCAAEDDVSVRFEPMEVVSVSFPTEIKVNEPNTVNVTYIRPTSCHYFEGFDYRNTSNTERTVYVMASVFKNDPCEELNETIGTSFDFEPKVKGNYIFKFWKGKDINNQDVFMVVEVLVE